MHVKIYEYFFVLSGIFAYLEESHTSVVGMRELVNNGHGENTKGIRIM